MGRGKWYVHPEDDAADGVALIVYSAEPSKIIDSRRLEWELTPDGHLRHVMSELFVNVEGKQLILRKTSDDMSRLSLTEEGHLKLGKLFVNAKRLTKGTKLDCTVDCE